ncbi:hypothetical protein SACC_08870 [Saccharolobus caldissimus]|uniref:Uncharacterized protein n=1 Tax=Saccharolobus caldissimus TaxID=1702097 RepID=A0AAQ4CPY9_9CREN|nr:hypothetical protein SACC_08870 [Saccharolobus caldissimus]
MDVASDPGYTPLFGEITKVTSPQFVGIVF